MGLSLQGRVTFDDPLLNNGLAHLDALTLPSGTYLYAGTGGSGGVLAFRLRTDGGLLQRIDTHIFPEALWPQLGHGLAAFPSGGQPTLLIGGAGGNGVQMMTLQADGRLANITVTGALPSGAMHISDAVQITIGGEVWTYLTEAGTGDIHWMRSDGGGLVTSSHGQLDLVQARHLAVTQVPSGDVLLATDAASNEVIAFRPNGTSGAVTEVGRLGPDNGLWIAVPTALVTVSSFGQSFAIVAGAGSNSLSVLHVTASGSLVPTDHLIDTRETRFGMPQDLATAQVGDHVFVVAGGGDDGVSLFQLLPTGRLVYLETLIHNTGQGLMNVAALEAVILGDTLYVFATSQSDGGVAQFNRSLAALGVAETNATSAARVTNGTTGDDLLVAGATGHDTLIGGAGDDLLVASDANVTLRGGAGRDRFVLKQAPALVLIEDFEAGVDVLDMSAFLFLRSPAQIDVTPTATGAEIVFRGTQVTVQSAGGAPLDRNAIFGVEFDHPDHLLLTPDLEPGGGGADPNTGTAGDDVLTGTEGDDTITGWGGKDTITAGLGNDVIDAGAGNDRIEAQAGDDFVTAGDGNDKVTLGDGNDIAFGGNGRDAIFGEAGADTIDGGGGQDALNGGTGADALWGAGDRDVLIGGPGDDALSGGNDPDEIFGNEGDDVLVGGTGDDLLEGGTGADVLFGNRGDDTLLGGEGHDKLWAGMGDDHLTGGAGRDLFVFSGEQGDNVITDFTHGMDVVQINVPGLAEQDVTMARVGDDTRLSFAETSVLLVGVAEPQLQDNDIILGW